MVGQGKNRGSSEGLDQCSKGILLRLVPMEGYVLPHKFCKGACDVQKSFYKLEIELQKPKNA